MQRLSQLRIAIICSLTLASTLALLTPTLAADRGTVENQPYEVARRLASRSHGKDSLCSFSQTLDFTSLVQLGRGASRNGDATIALDVFGREAVRRIRSGRVTPERFLSVLEEELQEGAFRHTLLRVVASTFETYPLESQRRAYESSVALAQSNTILPTERAFAITASSWILEALMASRSLRRDEIAGYCQGLVALAEDPVEDAQVKAAAIIAVSHVGFEPSLDSLLHAISDQKMMESTAVARSVCNGLGRLGASEGVEGISKLLNETSDEYVFASAAISLGDIGGWPAIKALVENQRRFYGDYCGVAIRMHENLILENLAGESGDLLPVAVEASRHIYSGSDREKAKRTLMSQLYPAQNHSLTKIILGTLSQMVTPEEAAQIVQRIERHESFSQEWDFLEALGHGTPVSHGSSDLRTTPFEADDWYGNRDAQEYADPGYRHNDIPDIWPIDLDWLGHTGICAGVDGNNLLHIIEVGTPLGFFVVQHNLWSGMQGKDQYWGARTLTAPEMTFERRRDVVSTAMEFVGRQVVYTYFDAIWVGIGSGSRIDPSEVRALRCDGLVEYCYEYNSLPVWGPNGGNWDISDGTDWAAHNDFYDEPYDPRTELAPIVQGGFTDPVGTTNMTVDAIVEPPSYNTSVSRSGDVVTVLITATDNSGIHYIKCSADPSGAIQTSGIRSQHPTSPSHTASFPFRMNELNQYGQIFFYAKDNGGNFPEYWEFIRVEVDVTIETSPSGRVITVDGTTYTAPRTFSWEIGSTHSIGVSSPQAGGSGVRYAYSSWNDGGSRTHDIVVPSTDRTYTASFSTQNYLTMAAGTGGSADPGSGWHDKGDQVRIQAEPQSGYTFDGWTGSGNGSYTGANNPANVTMNGPISENARFKQVPTSAITINTSPSGREITVDGSTYTAPKTFNWEIGSTHSIGVSSPQAGGTGVQYVYSSWSDGGSQNHNIVTPPTDRTYTASFSTQYYLTMMAGTGGSVSPGSEWRDKGDQVPIQAVPQSGYKFDGWTGSGSGSYTGQNNPASVSMNGPISEDARFKQVFTSEIAIATNPSGRVITVDSTTYTAPRTFSWEIGSTHSIGVSSPQTGGSGVRHTYSSWNDGGSQTHDIVVPSTDRTYTASFSTQYYLTMTAGTGGSVSPGSGWRDSGDRVTIEGTALRGYTFDAWTGSGSGSYTGASNPASVTVKGPIFESAGFVEAAPMAYRLYQNYPNPFNPGTEINFDLAEQCYVALRVYDISGRLVQTLLDDVFMDAGQQTWTWDGSTSDGRRAASGVYFYRIRAGSFTETRRMVLLR